MFVVLIVFNAVGICSMTPVCYWSMNNRLSGVGSLGDLFSVFCHVRFAHIPFGSRKEDSLQELLFLINISTWQSSLLTLNIPGKNVFGGN